MASTAPIAGIPEEIRQQIAGYLDYDDAWSLKQTSRLFLQVIEIPTIASFLQHPWGPSLEILEDWAIAPLDHEPCCYCRRFLPLDWYDSQQRKATVVRQDSDFGEYDYGTWLPEEHYCIDCGIEKRRYAWGQVIPTGFCDPGYEREGIIPCLHCGHKLSAVVAPCNHCPACESKLDTACVIIHNESSTTEDNHINSINSCAAADKRESTLETDQQSPIQSLSGEAAVIPPSEEAQCDDANLEAFDTSVSPSPRLSTVTNLSNSLQRRPSKFQRSRTYLKNAIGQVEKIFRPSIITFSEAPLTKPMIRAQSDYLQKQKWFCEPVSTAAQPWSWI